MAEVIKYARNYGRRTVCWLESEQQQILDGGYPLAHACLANYFRCAGTKLLLLPPTKKNPDCAEFSISGTRSGMLWKKLNNFACRTDLQLPPGMVIAARLSVQFTELSCRSRTAIGFGVIEKYGNLLTVDLADYAFDAIWDCILSDKIAPANTAIFTDERMKISVLYPIQKGVGKMSSNA